MKIKEVRMLKKRFYLLGVGALGLSLLISAALLHISKRLALILVLCGTIVVLACFFSFYEKAVRIERHECIRCSLHIPTREASRVRVSETQNGKEARVAYRVRRVCNVCGAEYEYTEYETS